MTTAGIPLNWILIMPDYRQIPSEVFFVFHFLNQIFDFLSIRHSQMFFFLINIFMKINTLLDSFEKQT
jgi:hypothetical protein